MTPSSGLWVVVTALTLAGGSGACVGEQFARFTTRSMWSEAGAPCPAPEEAIETLVGPNLVGVDRLVAAAALPRMCCYTGYDGCLASYDDLFGATLKRRADAPIGAREMCFLIEQGRSCPLPGALARVAYDGSACPPPAAGPIEHAARIRCTYRVEMDW